MKYDEKDVIVEHLNRDLLRKRSYSSELVREGGGGTG